MSEARECSPDRRKGRERKGIQVERGGGWAQVKRGEGEETGVQQVIKTECLVNFVGHGE